MNKPPVEMKQEQNSDSAKPSVTLLGTVDKVIVSPDPDEPDKAQIAIEGADDLYREIRVENALVDGHGTKVAFKEGAEVDVTIEADASATMPQV